MRTGRPKSALSINEEERAQLLSIVRARRLPSALTQRARIILACEQDANNKAVAADLGVGAHTVGKWRNRFITHRLEGLYDELRSGRPRTIEDEAIAELLIKTLAGKPKTGTHWSVRTMATEAGLSKRGCQISCVSGSRETLYLVEGVHGHGTIDQGRGY
jgi:putative transposase